MKAVHDGAGGVGLCLRCGGALEKLSGLGGEGRGKQRERLTLTLIQK